MRHISALATVVVLAVVVSAAPPPPPPPHGPSTITTHLTPPEQGAPLLRPKRGGPPPPKSATIPYSNYRRVSGVHRPYSAWKHLTSVRRYRYPLYRKRNYQPQYEYDDDLLLPEDTTEEMDYAGYPSFAPRPSLFRERNINQEQEMMEALAEEEEEKEKKELMLENEGYFHETPEEEHPGRVALHNYYQQLYGLPYSDLQRLNEMYEYGKRSDPDEYPPMPFSPPPGSVPIPVIAKTMAPTATGRFYDALSYVRKRATEMQSVDDEDEINEEPIREKKPQQYLTSAAGRYWRVRDEQQQQEQQQKTASPSSSIHDPEMMIRRRRKRNTTTTTAPATTQATKRRKTITTSPTKKPTTTTTTTTKPHHSAALTTTAPPSHHRDHRSKRAFSDWFKWEKRDDEEEVDEGDKDIDDFLTREYFKSIARSVGQKKKRMAYAEFEPEVDEDKRSTSVTLQDILSNPKILQYVQEKLKEVEEVMAREAQGLSSWQRPGSREEAAHREMSKAVLEMEALQHMQDALSQLQRLQEGRGGRMLGGRREIQLIEEARKRAAAQEKEEEERRGRMEGGGNKKRSVRRRLRRGDDIAELFLDNDKEECPVLWDILHRCSDVSAKVGDQSQVFLPACIKHEMCYGCGASQGISGHECDAVLSSALEAACPARSLDCLAAAGNTFSSLSRPANYDREGTCAHDPCVIHFLESR